LKKTTIGLLDPRASRHKTKQLKQTLFRRNGRGITTTEAGKRFLAHAHGIRHQVQCVRDDMAGSQDSPRGHVVIGLPTSVAKLLAVPLVKDVHARFPDATLGLVDGMSHSVNERVTTGRVDIGMAYNPVASAAVEIYPFIEDRLLLVGRRTGDKPRVKGRSVALADLPRYPLLLPSRPYVNRMQVEMQLGFLGLKPQIALEIDGVSPILELVHEDFGYAVFPKNMVLSDRLAGQLEVWPIVRPALTMHLSLILSAQRPTTLLTRLLLV
jgi:LysR family nitrogen assimilation transcriptional regulator